MPYHDLEAPYQDACAREERYMQIEKSEYNRIWEEFADELEVEKFIDGYEPANLLRDIVVRVAITRAELKKLSKDDKLTQTEKEQQRLIMMKNQFKTIELEIDEHIEKLAACKAQQIFNYDL